MSEKFIVLYLHARVNSSYKSMQEIKNTHIWCGKGDIGYLLCVSVLKIAAN